MEKMESVCARSWDNEAECSSDAVLLISHKIVVCTVVERTVEVVEVGQTAVWLSRRLFNQTQERQFIPGRVKPLPGTGDTRLVKV